MQIDVILDTRARPAELLALGRLAERSGIRGVWVSSLLDSRDPFANLMFVAQGTTRLGLGPIAVNPFDTHPVKIAAALLTLNEAAGGRARIVVGGGGEALRALDIQPRRRVTAVRECVEILRAAASGGPVNHAGPLYHVHQLRLGWLESPPPALYVGASQVQMLRMAAACADGVMMSDMPPGPAAAALGTLARALAEQGRPRDRFHTSAFTAWHVYPDLAEARREARRWLLLRGIFRPWLLADFLDPPDVARVMESLPAFQRAFAAGSDQVDGVPDRILDALVDHVTLTGTTRAPADLVERLGHLRDAGLASVALRLYANPADSIRFIGRHLVPALAD